MAVRCVSGRGACRSQCPRRRRSGSRRPHVEDLSVSGSPEGVPADMRRVVTCMTNSSATRVLDEEPQPAAARGSSRSRTASAAYMSASAHWIAHPPFAPRWLRWRVPEPPICAVAAGQAQLSSPRARPPSTSRVTPLIYPASLEQRNAAAAAISSGDPNRRNGMVSASRARAASGSDSLE
jgi:hypothetical protein